MKNKQIDNEIYKKIADSWWDNSSSFASLRYFLNPVRFKYFKKVLEKKLNIDYKGKNVLDIGCGGGFLSEELAKIGMNVTGVDPAIELIKIADNHAKQEGLNINYVEGIGENLPFENNSFDIVYCCDVLEHINNLDIVISEISRILKNNGIFFYDTINRNFMSNIAVIKIMQEWKFTAFLPENIHAFDKFIKPGELVYIMNKYKLVSNGIKGISPGINFLSHYINMRKKVKGLINYKELAKKLNLHESNNKFISYMGYSLKT